LISFVVPAFNEERLLPLTLSSIHTAMRAIGEPYEIVVADDASTDRTATIAAELGARVVRVSNRQIAATRNAGVRAARGEWLVFVDADTIVNEGVVLAAIAALHGGAVGGGAEVRFEGRVPAWATMMLATLLMIFRAMRLGAGCFLFCTREAFAAVGGFDETMFAAEEIAISRSLGRQGRFVVLRESVLTSGRKLRTHSGREILRTFGVLALRGPSSVRDRQALDMWYEARRDDPPTTEPETSDREAAS
jgi:glycosyltransferase involved in cell wall biosynthesis